MHTMTDTLEEVRREHRRLAAHVEALKVAADAVHRTPGRDTFELVDESWRFVSEHLLHHARTEERTIYVALTDALGTPAATRLLTIDHEAITELVGELGTLRRAAADHDTIPDDVARSLRRVLYGLYALIRTHFAKEEEVVLGILEARLTR